MGYLKEVNSATEQFITGGKDSVVIIQHEKGLAGGRTLDTTGYTPNTIFAGHVVIRETATGVYKPMPVTGQPYADGNAYAALPSGHTYEGIVTASVRTAHPFVGVMVGGMANELATPYPIAAIKTAFMAAVPHIYWTSDNK